MPFRPASFLKVGRGRLAQRPSPIDHDCPLDSARGRSLGTRGGTARDNDDGSYLAVTVQLARKVGPSSVIHRPVGKSPEGLRQPGRETRTLARPLKWCLVAAAL